MEDTGKELDMLSSLTDTELIIADICSRCGGNAPTIIFQHMIEQELSANLSIVQNEVENLRRCRKYKLLHYFGLIPHNAAVGLMSTDQYVIDLEHKLSSDSFLATKFSSWLREQSNISMTFLALNNECSITSEEIGRLVELGFLRLRSSALNNELRSEDQQAYWLSHPTLSHIAHHLSTAEKYIVATLKRLRFKEMQSKDFHALFPSSSHPLAEEEARSGKRRRKANPDNLSVNDLYMQRRKADSSEKKLCPSPLPSHYHLLDLLGRKVITATPTADKRSILLRLG